MTTDKTADFERNPQYEHRLVVFYDILGWRSRIERTGNDPPKIGEKRRHVLVGPRVLTAQTPSPTSDVRFSAFSDNIVISQMVSTAHAIHFLATLCSFQIGSATDGYLIRGGVTVGNLHHDAESVFGPALNRAYYLESEIADVPRIIVDENVLELCIPRPFFLVEEDGVNFIDPFTHHFVQLLQDMNMPKQAYWEHIGFPIPNGFSLKTTPREQLLRESLDAMKPVLRGPIRDKDWNKMAWLYDRIAGRLGVPLAGSYPRQRIED